MRQLGLLLALAACDDRGEAELYRDALAAPTWEEGRDLCARLPEEHGADCLVGVMEAHGRLEAGDCDLVPAGVWRHECVFLYAEREARAGNLAEAFSACESTSFGRECSFHLIRAGARGVLDRPVAEAAAAAVPYTGLPRAPDAQHLFWRTWFKERMEAKVPVDPTGCPTSECVEGAHQAVLLALEVVARTEGEGFCDGSVPDGHGPDRVYWMEGPHTVGWVAEFVDGECARREGRRRGPGGPGARGRPEARPHEARPGARPDEAREASPG